MIRIYGFPNTRSTRVTWALEQAGVDYEFMVVDLSKGEHKKPEYLKVNPYGKVPALIDGELVLSESAAICTYIGEKFPSSELVPKEITERANYFQWCFFAISELEAPLWTMVKHNRILAEEQRVPAIAKICVWEFQRAASVLAQHLEGREFAIGNCFSAADILLSSTLNWAIHEGVVIESKTLTEYAKRMSLRPALKCAKNREVESYLS